MWPAAWKSGVPPVWIPRGSGRWTGLPHLSAAFTQANGYTVRTHLLLSLFEQLLERPGLLPCGPPAAAVAAVSSLQPAGQEPPGQVNGYLPPLCRVPAEDAALWTAASPAKQVRPSGMLDTVWPSHHNSNILNYDSSIINDQIICSAIVCNRLASFPFFEPSVSC